MSAPINAAASLQDNILFGKLAYGQARGAERVGEIIANVIDDLGPPRSGYGSGPELPRRQWWRAIVEAPNARSSALPARF